MSEQIAPIYQAIEFIESHLHEDVTVSQIAESAGYSLFHFMRKFNQMVHLTPYDYLIRRRLTEAAKALIFGKHRIIDIGQDFCFNDQETFSHVFRKMFKMTPSQCRKGKSINSFNFMPAITIEDLLFINGDHFDPPMIVDYSQIPLVGLMSLISEDKSKVELQRQHILSDLAVVCQIEPQAKIYELRHQIQSQQSSQYFFIGMEDSQTKVSNPSLVRHMLDEGKYVKMSVLESQITFAIRYLYSTWVLGNCVDINSDLVIICWSYTKMFSDQRITVLIPIKNY